MTALTDTMGVTRLYQNEEEVIEVSGNTIRTGVKIMLDTALLRTTISPSAKEVISVAEVQPTPQRETIVAKRKSAVSASDAKAATSSERKTLAATIVSCYHYYPVLSTVVHAATLGSLALYSIYRIWGIVIVNPYALIWAIIGFGGLSIVLASAAREIDESNRED